MPAKYHKDLCEKVVLKRKRDGQTYAAIALDLGVSVNFCRSVIQLWEEGEAIEKHGKLGTKTSTRAFDQNTLAELRDIVENNQTLYLDEMAALLLERTGKSVSLSTLWRATQEAGFSHKKLHKRALECDEALRSAYRTRCQTSFDMEQLLFIDESHVDSRTTDRKNGWATRGERTSTKSQFVRRRRYTMLPIMSSEGILDYQLLQGSSNAETMDMFGESCLIEKMFSQVKAWLMREQAWVATIPPEEALKEALSSVTPEHCLHYIQSCGTMYTS